MVAFFSAGIIATSHKMEKGGQDNFKNCFSSPLCLIVQCVK